MEGDWLVDQSFTGKWIFVGNRGDGHLRLIGLIGLGPASRVFTCSLLDRLLSSFNLPTKCLIWPSYTNNIHRPWAFTCLVPPRGNVESWIDWPSGRVFIPTFWPGPSRAGSELADPTRPAKQSNMTSRELNIEIFSGFMLLHYLFALPFW